MPEEKGIGSKILGLFVESPDGGSKEGDPSRPGERSAADEIAELARASGAAPGPQGGPPGAPPPAPGAPPLKLSPAAAPSDGPVDFAAIFRDAGMDPEELDRVKKAED